MGTEWPWCAVFKHRKAGPLELLQEAVAAAAADSPLPDGAASLGLGLGAQ